jgi:hypothetical protein
MTVKDREALSDLFDQVYCMCIETELKREDVDRVVSEAWERATHHARQVVTIAEDGRIEGRRD